mmetsp:Transcript_18110/g.37847  ORF Transcript_18110/g.37847 Transcript_18110/m.37847 type:complete len:156 (+) Transcript_18110:132-599(+)
MASLGDKLVHLSLEIDDRTKSVELIRQLIEDQSARHEREVANFEKQQDVVLQEMTAENKDTETKLSRMNESLMQRKKALECQMNELSKQQEAVEYSKKKKLDDVRRDIAVAKESAYNAYRQEKAQREKAWFDGRVSEIHKLTWKGVCVAVCSSFF